MRTDHATVARNSSPAPHTSINTPRAVSQRRAPGYPWGHGLPHHCEIAVDERENAEANHSDGEKGNGGLKVWLRALRGDGSWSGLAGNFENGGWLESSHGNLNVLKTG